MASEPDERAADGAGEPHAGALIPLSSGVARGIQAFRRGEAILYTVRGEPAKVQELISQLDKQGVDELIALISHRSPEPLPAEDDRQKEDETEPEQQRRK